MDDGDRAPGDTVAPDGAMPIGDTVSAFFESGADYARAEIDWAKATAAFMGRGIRDAAIMVGVAAIILMATLTVLLGAILMLLLPPLGLGGATAVTCGTGILIAVALLLAAKARIAALKDDR